MSPLIHAHRWVVQTQDKIPTLRSNLEISDTVGANKAVVEDIEIVLNYKIRQYLITLYFNSSH